MKDDIVTLRRLLEERCKKIGKRVGVFINYDSFRISEDTYDNYADMDRYMLEHYYTTITRFATSAFMRMKLGEAFTRRNIAPHVFEKKEDAQAFLSSLDLGQARGELMRPSSCADRSRPREVIAAAVEGLGSALACRRCCCKSSC